jgi:hypothetical protein
MNGILRGRKTLSMEMIAVQDDLFPKKLDELHEMLRMKIQDGTYVDGADLNDSQEIKSINALFWDRMKMKIFVTWEKNGAHVLPFYINGKSVFNRFNNPPEIVQVDQAKQIRGYKNGDVGTVNEETAKLGGIFSEYETYVFVDYLHDFNPRGLNLSAREASAVLVHEVGHAFYIMAYSDRISRTNQILSSILDEVRGKGKKADRQFIYRELKHIDDKVDQAEVDAFVDGESTVIGYRWYLRVMDSLGKISSTQINGKYGETSFEALSDNFASRFGYGRDLVGALDKIYSKMRVPEKNIFMALGIAINDLLALHGLFGSLMTVTVGAGVILAKAAWAYPVLLYVAYMQLMNLYHTGAQHKDYTYDDVRDRYKRIRQDMVQQLKASGIRSDLKSKIIVSIEQVDQIMDKTREFQRPMTMLSNFLFSDNRSTRKNVLEQQLMEELGNNDLFLKSAQLSTI